MENLEGNFKIEDEPILVVSEEMRSYLYEIARWANFLAIVGFVLAGILTIAAIVFGAFVSSNEDFAQTAGQFAGISKTIYTVVNLVVAFAIFYPSLLLMKYSSNAKQGILYGEQTHLNEALSKLKSLFVFWGVMTIIYIALTLMTVVSTFTGSLATS